MSDETPSQSSLENQAARNKKKEGDPQSESPFEPEVLGKLPPEVRRAVEFSLQAVSGPVFHPIVKKITEGHIDKVLDQTDKDSDRDFKDRASSRRYGFAAFIIICALFVFITWYLTSVDKDLYRDIVKVLLGLAGGFGGGFAFKGYLDRDKD